MLCIKCNKEMYIDSSSDYTFLRCSHCNHTALYIPTLNNLTLVLAKRKEAEKNRKATESKRAVLEEERAKMKMLIYRRR